MGRSPVEVSRGPSEPPVDESDLVRFGWGSAGLHHPDQPRECECIPAWKREMHPTVQSRSVGKSPAGDLYRPGRPTA